MIPCSEMNVFSDLKVSLPVAWNVCKPFVTEGQGQVWVGPGELLSFLMKSPNNEHPVLALQLQCLGPTILILIQRQRHVAQVLTQWDKLSVLHVYSLQIQLTHLSMPLVSEGEQKKTLFLNQPTTTVKGMGNNVVNFFQVACLFAETL